MTLPSSAKLHSRPLQRYTTALCKTTLPSSAKIHSCPLQNYTPALCKTTLPSSAKLHSRPLQRYTPVLCKADHCVALQKMATLAHAWWHLPGLKPYLHFQLSLFAGQGEDVDERPMQCSIPACAGIYAGRVRSTTSTFPLQRLPCQVSGVVGSCLDWLARCQYTVTG